jgi:hypothetical protein
MQTLQQLLEQHGWIIAYGAPEYRAHAPMLGPIPFQIAEGIDPKGHCIHPKYKPAIQTHETSRQNVKYYYEPLDAMKDALVSCREAMVHQRDEIQGILNSAWQRWVTRPVELSAKNYRISLVRKLARCNTLLETTTNEQAIQSLMDRSDLPDMDTITPTLPVNVGEHVYTLWDGLFSKGKLTLQEHRVKKIHLDFTSSKKTLMAEFRIKCSGNFSFTFNHDDELQDARIAYGASNVRLFITREAAEADVTRLIKGVSVDFRPAKA